MLVNVNIVQVEVLGWKWKEAPEDSAFFFPQFFIKYIL